MGTHALLQESVGFRRLGLVVIDEQHRFGVEQRAALIGKGAAPDVLLLSATPIPRSLALTLYGDLDVSRLRERPPGRGTVRTAVRGEAQRERVLDFVEAQCRAGRQAYVVLPVIEESEKADLRAATTMAEVLTARWPELSVGLVHGRLKAEERDRVMRRFRDGEVQVLVATTVIEVGIDVPNATVLVIENPERFGLAQLHQLRGRIGRGAGDSHCILLSGGRTPERLKAFAATNDGFEIAELDLRERGHGGPHRRAAVGGHRGAPCPPPRRRAAAAARARTRLGRPGRGSRPAAAGQPGPPVPGAGALSTGGGVVPRRVAGVNCIPCFPLARPSPMPFASINELSRHVGQAVTVRGWVSTTRSSGKIAFVVVRDGSGYLQAVFSKREVSEETWARLGALTQETSVAVTGEVRADARAPGGHELTATALEILGASPDFPISPKEHGSTFLFEHRHLWLRSRRQVAIARVRNEVEQAIRDFFYERDFVLVDTPILTGSIGEEAGNLFSTDYFDLGKAYLAQTGQLYVEAAAAALGKVYCFGPTFRAEKSKTRRHLTEFWMVEPEVAWNDSDANMRLQEDFVTAIVRRVLERRQEELKELERDTAPLERVVGPFPRITYTDAVDQAAGARVGHHVGQGPGRGRRNAAGQAVRPAGLRVQLPEGHQGLLHEGKSRRPPHDPRQRLPRAGGIRRDHRWITARGRPRQAAGAHRRAGARPRGVPVVPGPAEVRHLRAQRIRAWASSARWRGSAATPTSGNRSRSRGRSTGSIRSAAPASPRPTAHPASPAPPSAGRFRARRPGVRRPGTGR